jgi:hypothetical protein
LLDIAALAVLVILIVLPMPSRAIDVLYVHDRAPLGPEIAEAQADLARHPDDAIAASRLSDLLVRARQTDWAVRVAARAAQVPSPQKWRAQVAAAAAQAERVEFGPALEWAQRAMATCEEPGQDCPDFEKARLEMYVNALRAGWDSGIDPRTNPQGFQDAVRKTAPVIRNQKPKPNPN